MSPEARNWLTAWRLRGAPLSISLAQALALPEGILGRSGCPLFIVYAGRVDVVFAYEDLDKELMGLAPYRVDLDRYETLEEAKQALWRILAPDGAKPYEAVVDERSTDHA